MHINLLKKFFALRGFPHSNLVARKVNFTAKPISISLIKPITPYYSGSRSYVTTALAQETVQDKSNASEEIDYSDLKTRKNITSMIYYQLEAVKKLRRNLIEEEEKVLCELFPELSDKMEEEHRMRNDEFYIVENGYTPFNLRSYFEDIYQEQPEKYKEKADSCEKLETLSEFFNSSKGYRGFAKPIRHELIIDIPRFKEYLEKIKKYSRTFNNMELLEHVEKQFDEEFWEMAIFLTKYYPGYRKYYVEQGTNVLNSVDFDFLGVLTEKF